MIESHTRECTRLKKDVNKKFIAKSLLFRFFFLLFSAAPESCSTTAAAVERKRKR
jgi:hypothetical protein